MIIIQDISFIFYTNSIRRLLFPFYTQRNWELEILSFLKVTHGSFFSTDVRSCSDMPENEDFYFSIWKIFLRAHSSYLWREHKTFPKFPCSAHKRRCSEDGQRQTTGGETFSRRSKIFLRFLLLKRLSENQAAAHTNRLHIPHDFLRAWRADLTS